VSGRGISWAICKSAPRSRQITTPAPHHSVFYRPNALPAAQPTASKHWRHTVMMQVPWELNASVVLVLASTAEWNTDNCYRCRSGFMLGHTGVSCKSGWSDHEPVWGSRVGQMRRVLDWMQISATWWILNNLWVWMVALRCYVKLLLTTCYTWDTCNRRQHTDNMHTSTDCVRTCMTIPWSQLWRYVFLDNWTLQQTGFWMGWTLTQPVPTAHHTKI